MVQFIIITGPMFSGKTTELLRLKSREDVSKRKSLFFKPFVDKRYNENSVVNHNGIKEYAINIDNSKDILNHIKDSKQKITNVFIDEIQFFDSYIINVIDKLIDKKINVYACGLNQTFNGYPFPLKDKKKHVGYLMAIADKVISIDAVCNNCGGVATKTYRLTKTKKTVDIGGIDKYQARCNDCFKK